MPRRWPSRRRPRICTGPRFRLRRSPGRLPDHIGTVSSSGVATGVAEGDAIITASSGGVSGTANLTVIGDLNTVLGVSTKLVPRSDACGATDGRHCESIVGDVITDAMRFTYSVDFAITNSGGIRADLTCPTSDDVVDFCPAYVPPPFPITRGQVLSVLPFGNRAVTLSLNGAELKVMLEIGVSQMPLQTDGSRRYRGSASRMTSACPSAPASSLPSGRRPTARAPVRRSISRVAGRTRWQRTTSWLLVEIPILTSPQEPRCVRS